MEFVRVLPEDERAVQALSALAVSIVKEHFDPIIGPAQNDYMIGRFQSVPAITDQLWHGYQYYFVRDSLGKNIGFLAFYSRDDTLYLSKFYLRKDRRGQGLSRDMLAFTAARARSMGLASITLNVNRNNDAILAYERLGFHRIGAEKNDIGNGFYMDDYVYRYNCAP